MLAAFLFMRRMAEVTNISAITHELRDPADDFESDPNAVRRRAVPPEVEVYEINGPFFFGAAALRDLVARSRRRGSLVLLSEVHAQPVVALERSGLYEELGEENIHGNIDDALNRAREYLGLPPIVRPAFATPTVAREKPGAQRP